MQVIPAAAQGANYDIGADSGVTGDVAHRVIESLIGAVVAGGDSDLLAGGFNQGCGCWGEFDGGGWVSFGVGIGAQ